MGGGMGGMQGGFGAQGYGGNPQGEIFVVLIIRLDLMSVGFRRVRWAARLWSRRLRPARWRLRLARLWRCCRLRWSGVLIDLFLCSTYFQGSALSTVLIYYPVISLFFSSVRLPSSISSECFSSLDFYDVLSIAPPDALIHAHPPCLLPVPVVSLSTGR